MTAIELLGLGWLVGLSFAILLLWIRVLRIAQEVDSMQTSVREVNSQLAGIRLSLEGLARFQQVEDLRRQIVNDLRPMIGDAAANAVNNARKPVRAGKQVGIEVSGAVAGGNIGAWQRAQKEDAVQIMRPAADPEPLPSRRDARRQTLEEHRAAAEDSKPTRGD